MPIPRPAPDNLHGPSRTTSKAMEATLIAGAGYYRRATMLRRLLPQVVVSEKAEATQTSALIMAALREALRRERARAGHWSYDLNRHIGLAQALRAELELQKKCVGSN